MERYIGIKMKNWAVRDSEGILLFRGFFFILNKNSVYVCDKELSMWSHIEVIMTVYEDNDHI